MNRKFLFFLQFFLLSLISFSQEVPLINTFTTEDYGAENQNWSISQGKDNFIYVANNKGLLEFNGENWNLYPTPNETIMRSVYCFENKIYTGFYRDFGFWQKDDFGLLKYTSIVRSSDVQMLEDEQVWEIVELDGWLLFKSLERIYLYHIASKEIKIIESENNLTKLARVENAVYFQDLNRGIFMIENGFKKLISDHKIVKENKIINIFQKDNKLLFLSQKNGFFYLEDNEIQKWEIPYQNSLLKKTIYSAAVLKDGGFVLGTISNGLIYLNENGNLNYKITQSLGLSNNTVLSVFEDNDNNLWLGLDNGINTINLSSPFKLFIKKNNFWGTIYTSILFQGNLYLGTNQGLYYKNQKTDNDFKLIPNTEGQVWNLQNINNTLFCSHDSGTFIIDNKKAKLIQNVTGAWGIRIIDENRLLQGSYDGLYVLEKKNKVWTLRNKLNGFSNSSRYFLITVNNKIFVNHEYKGIFKLEVDDDFRKVKNLSEDLSVEKGIHSSLVEYQNKILYSSKRGVYKYNASSDSFKIDSLYSRLMPKDKFLSAKIIHETANNKLWSFTKDDIRYLSPGKLSDEPKIEIIPIKGSLHKGASGYENIINLFDKTYLVGTSDGYLIIDLKKIKKPKDFNVYINKVFNSQLDNKESNVSLTTISKFRHKQNNLKFYYSVPNYIKTASVKYEYILEGFNENWIGKSDLNYCLFKNVSPGEYTFKVKAFIDGKASSNIASYKFEILKPWYTSTLFKAIYALIFVVFMAILHLLSRRYYKKQREKLLDKKQKELELKELENSQKIIKINNEKLRSDIESKNRELATSTMSIIKKNEFLNSIKNELISGGDHKIDKVIKIINKNLNNNDDWKMFQEAFNNADKNFLKKVKTKHPELTPNDLRLCAYLRLNLSSKEIAPLLNISPRSVEVKRYRLRKKMKLEHDANLTNYIINI